MTWLLEPTDNVRAFLELVLPELGQSIAEDSLRPLESSLISDDFQQLHEDLVYEAQLLCEGDGEEPRELAFVILVAHQSYQDSLMPFRFLNAMTKVWERDLRSQVENRVPKPARRLRGIVPILVATCEKPWRKRSLGDLFERTELLEPYLPEFQVAILDLATEEQLCSKAGALGPLLHLFQAQWRKQGFDEELRRVLRALRALELGEEGLKAAVWFCLQFVWHRRQRKEWDRMKELATELVGEMDGQNMEQSLQDTFPGYYKELGRKEGRLSLVTEALRIRFPGKDESEIQSELAERSREEELKALLAKIIQGSTWEELWE